jgi:hypothetical protein
MAEKKSIIEEALLDIANVQNALNANTKEILRSVAKEEIDSVVKESLMDEVYEEEEVKLGDATNEADDDYSEEGPEMGGEDMGTEVLGGDEIDMTGASDDDVIAIYKKLSGDDEIEIVGDEIRMNISEPGEYVVKLDSVAGNDEIEVGDEDEEELNLDSEDSEEDEFNMGGEEDDDEVEYEIEMGDDDSEEEEHEAEESEEEEEEHESEKEEEEEDELEESIRKNAADARKAGAEHQPIAPGAEQEAKFLGIKESEKAKKLVSEATKRYNSLLTEATKLKAENDEFRTALKEFRTKLVETVVFNSNLTYVTKLFMEHSTTKAEKQNIIKRFDEEVTTLKESKKLYKTIAGELDTRKPIAESVESKIIKESTSSVSKQLNESTAYVDPSTSRILDLIQRVEKR